jgi:hypothetical protein
LPLINKPIYCLVMQRRRIPKNRHATLRATALRRIAQIGPFLEGSLCSFTRPGCAQPGWHLTFKQKKRTRTVYVPMDLVPEVKKWNLNYRHLKKLIREVTRHSLGLIHRHVANRRAASPIQPSISKKPSKVPSKSYGGASPI